MPASEPGGPVLSVVVPMYDEEAVLPLFAARLRPVLDALAEPYEVLAVSFVSGRTPGAPALPDAGRAGLSNPPGGRQDARAARRLRGRGRR